MAVSMLALVGCYGWPRSEGGPPSGEDGTIGGFSLDYPPPPVEPWEPPEIEPAPPSRVDCGDDMVEIPDLGLCIDRYEASEGPVGALSLRGAVPRRVVDAVAAERACRNVGKRLCTAEEWTAACSGPTRPGAYPYGQEYERARCNVDQVGIVRATGVTYPDCEGGYPGLFDMSGNVLEWTSTCSDRDCVAIGGSRNAPPEFARCDAGQWWPAATRASHIGVRCCATLPE